MLENNMIMEYKYALATFVIKMGTMHICILGTMVDNRLVGYFISRSKNEGGIQRGLAPFGTRLCKAKCSVLYPLSVRLRKIGVCESGVNAFVHYIPFPICQTVSDKLM